MEEVGTQVGNAGGEGTGERWRRKEVSTQVGDEGGKR